MYLGFIEGDHGAGLLSAQATARAADRTDTLYEQVLVTEGER